MPNEIQNIQPQEKRSIIPFLIILSLIIFTGIGGFAAYNLFLKNKEQVTSSTTITPTSGLVAQAPSPTPIVIPQVTLVPTAIPTASVSPTLLPTVKPALTPTNAPITPTAKPTSAFVPTTQPLPTSLPQTSKGNLPDAGNSSYTLIFLGSGVILLSVSTKLLKS